MKDMAEVQDLLCRMSRQQLGMEWVTLTASTLQGNKSIDEVALRYSTIHCLLLVIRDYTYRCINAIQQSHHKYPDQSESLWK